APWEKGHPSNWKRRDRYRAFEGTERPHQGHGRAFLRLSKGAWPKTRGSWVNVETVLLVPVDLLIFFTK
ncbi:hypothetical protein B0T20DRAFT_341272, partial [Sordaria brevicollis]